MASNGLPSPIAPDDARAAAPPRSRWQKFRLVVKVVELRLRFVALMALTGLVFAYWDTLWNHYDKWMRPAGHSHAADSGVEYYCPMHPQVVQQEPGSCPICGMPLAKRKKGEKQTLPEGVLARVQLAPFRRAQAGIRTAEVAYAPLVQTVTTVGYVAFDERRLAHIASKVPGKTRVETLYANYTGMDVRAGQPLAELYSPELDQAVQELLTAARRADVSTTAMRSAAGRALLGDRQELVRLSAEKLERWGITQAQVDGILRTRKADATVPVLAPIAGHVVKKNVVAGQEVQEGYPMFEVADLSRVWVEAQVYEHEVGLVNEGQPVEATVDALPGRTFAGTVEFVQPHLDTATRTVQVRYSLDNPEHKLRPGMFATVTLKTPVAETPQFQSRLAAAPHSHAKAAHVRLTAAQQKTCPVTGAGLGSMDEPVSAEVRGRTVWTCCDACPPKLHAAPDKYLAKLSAPAVERPPASSAEEQQVCPVTGAKLGSMGEPVPVVLDGRKVWTCCKACPPKLKADPARFLARLTPAPRDEVLSVPESAVVDTGTRKLVYVEAEPGIFEGRQVVLGPRIGDRFPVVEGLAPGEKVAAEGAFLIDAESRLNPVAPAPSDGAAAPAEAHRH